MCDTLVALPENGLKCTFFAKNSDRDPDEVHEVHLFPPTLHRPGDRVQTTYLTLPQAAETRGVLLSKPFWIWGAEMGVNDAGLVIGNEAIFTRLPREKTPGLIGMDLLRLALERCTSASDAVRLIGQMVEQYGQGGGCGYRNKKFQYDNSFLIADAVEAYVLECYGREWAARRVQGMAAISNRISLEGDWDLASEHLGEAAKKRGWWKPGTPLHLEAVYSELVITRFARGRERQACSLEWLQNEANRRDPQAWVQALRQHGTNRRMYWPDQGSNRDVCMHAADPLIRKSQTTGSMIACIQGNQVPLVFVTGTSAPCFSIFKPVFLDVELPWTYPQPTPETYHPGHLWWAHERLHRRLLFADRIAAVTFREERDAMEREFIREAFDLLGAPKASRQEFVNRCFRRAQEFEQRWLARLARRKPRRTKWGYRLYWWWLNRRNRMPAEP